MAHLIFNLVTGLVALAFIYPLTRLVDKLSISFGITADDYTLKLALFHTIFNVLGVLIMIPLIHKLEQFLLRFVRDHRIKDIDEPKFLNEAALEFAGTAISSLENETKYLFENATYEIVTHALNMHRSDISSNLKPKALVKKSTKEIDIDVRNLYVHKVKTIYGKILEFATRTQTELELNKAQNKRISEIKIANRKMVEVIRDVKELRRNVSKFTNSDNEYIKKEYNGFRKQMVKVFRAIYAFKMDENKETSYAELLEMRKKAKVRSKRDSNQINNLIRKNLITTNMASSVVNDHDNVDDMIKNLIEVGQLVYSEKDSILEPA